MGTLQHIHTTRGSHFSDISNSDEHPCGLAPSMSLLHVAFAAKSVELLRKCPTLTGPKSTEEWNQDHGNGLITVENALPKRGRGASGKADNFFNNGYFFMPQLQKMARGELPLPIPKTGPAPSHATVRRREGERAGADGAIATGFRKLPESML
jgi:hypothetical protein